MKSYENLSEKMTTAHEAFQKYLTRSEKIYLGEERKLILQAIDEILMETPPEEFYQDAMKTIAEHPGLSGNGYPGDPDKPGEPFELISRLPIVYVVYRLAKTILAPSKTIMKASSSYGLKHDFESVLGVYVTNGELILALLMAGFKTGRLSKMNVHFNIGKKTYNGLEKLRAEASANSRYAKLDWARTAMAENGGKVPRGGRSHKEEGMVL